MNAWIEAVVAAARFVAALAAGQTHFLDRTSGARFRLADPLATRVECEGAIGISNEGRAGIVDRSLAAVVRVFEADPGQHLESPRQDLELRLGICGRELLADEFGSVSARHRFRRDLGRSLRNKRRVGLISPGGGDDVHERDILNSEPGVLVDIHLHAVGVGGEVAIVTVVGEVAHRDAAVAPLGPLQRTDLE